MSTQIKPINPKHLNHPELVQPPVGQAEIIARNLKRWQEEQKKKQQKREKLAATAQARGLSVAALLEQKKARLRLQNCRATVGEIIAQHLKAATK